MLEPIFRETVNVNNWIRLFPLILTDQKHKFILGGENSLTSAAAAARTVGGFFFPIPRTCFYFFGVFIGFSTSTNKAWKKILAINSSNQQVHLEGI